MSEIKPVPADDAASRSTSSDSTTGADGASPCYSTSIDVSDGEDPVPCSLPHTAEIVATVRPSAAATAFPGEADLFDEGTEQCAEAFMEISGVAIETAIPSLVVVFPDESGWEDGNQTIACVLEYPRALSERLADIDPRRALGLATFYGLEIGDCLPSLDQSSGGLVLVPCDAVHTIEVYEVLPIDDATYPGDEEIDSQALQHCFAEYESLYGTATSVDDAPFDFLAPSAESWADYGDRSIVCIAAVSPGA